MLSFPELIFIVIVQSNDNMNILFTKYSRIRTMFDCKHFFTV